MPAYFDRPESVEDEMRRRMLSGLGGPAGPPIGNPQSSIVNRPDPYAQVPTAGTQGMTVEGLLQGLLAALREMGEQSRSEREERGDRAKEERGEASSRATGGQIGGMSDVQRANVARSPYPVQTAGTAAMVNRRRDIGSLPGVKDPRAKYWHGQDRRPRETDEEYERRMMRVQEAHEHRRKKAADKNRAVTRRSRMRKALTGKAGTGLMVKKTAGGYQPSTYVEGHGSRKLPEQTTAEGAASSARQRIQETLESEKFSDQMSRRMARLMGLLGSYR